MWIMIQCSKEMFIRGPYIFHPMKNLLGYFVMKNVIDEFPERIKIGLLSNRTVIYYIDRPGGVLP